jgi:hypothetical protein
MLHAKKLLFLLFMKLLDFSIDLHIYWGYGPRLDLGPNRNEYQKSSRW